MRWNLYRISITGTGLFIPLIALAIHSLDRTLHIAIAVIIHSFDRSLQGMVRSHYPLIADYRSSFLCALA